MAAKKFLRNVAGAIQEILGIQSSTGASNAGDIPALDDNGYLDYSMLYSQSTWQRKASYTFTDFLSTSTTQSPPWTGSASSSGTITTTANADLTGRAGVITARSSTTAGSGYNWVTSNHIMVKGGEKFSFIAAPLNNGSTTTTRMGLGDYSSPTVTAANAISFEISNLVAQGFCANGSTRTSTASTYTMTAGTFYHFVAAVNSNATQVTFTIYSESGTQLWTDTVTTNIPTTNPLFHGWRTANSGTTALNLFSIDYMDLIIPFSTMRGAPLTANF